jgi:hypothetical protein|tara:strand:+ start:613 stop:789 length:177 start_codon:yes stop_codon:yes gene_type:complete
MLELSTGTDGAYYMWGAVVEGLVIVFLCKEVGALHWNLVKTTNKFFKNSGGYMRKLKN